MGLGRVASIALSVPLLMIVGVVVVLGGDDEAAVAAPAPGVATPGLCLPDLATGTVTITGSHAPVADISELGLNADQTQIAKTIVSVVKGRGLPLRAAEIALATGWVESNLRNLLVAVDHDSLGVFQQRPSMIGWGTAEEIVDVVHATNAFLDGLVKIDGWETADRGDVAQAVQQSAVPDAYNRIGMPIGIPLAAALWTGTPAGTPAACSPVATGSQGPADPVKASGAAKVALERARSQIGLPYCWAGGDANGPTHGEGGDGCGGDAVGFDCSGLMIYAWAGNGVNLPHRSAIQATMGTHVPMAQAQPGDLVFWDDGGGVHHVAMIYSLDPGTTTGAGEIIEAQDFGVPVHIRRWTGTENSEVLNYAARFTVA